VLTVDVGTSFTVARDDPWRELVRVVAVVLAAIVLARLVGRLDQVIGFVLLAATVALITAPVRDRFASRMPGGLAAALTAFATFAGIVAVSALLIRGLAGEADRLATELTAQLDGLRPGTLPARVAASLDAQAGIDEVVSRVPSSLVTGEEDTVGIGRRLIDVLLVVILAAFFQASVSGIHDRIVTLWPRSRRAEVRCLTADLVARGGGFVRRILLLALVAWPAIALAAALLDIPGAVVVGAWFALWATVPWVGGWIGAAPLVALAAIDAPWRGGVAVIIAIIVAMGIAVARQRLVEARTIELGAAVTVLAMATGLAVGGFGGAVVTLSIAAVGRAWMTSNHRVERPSATVLDPVEDIDASDHRAPGGFDAVVSTTDGDIRLAPGWRGVLTVLGAVAGAALFWSGLTAVGAVAVWLVVAVLLSVALHRPVGWVQRRSHTSRPVAIGIVSLGGLTVVAAATMLAVAGGADTGAELSEELPTVVEDLSTLPVVGPWLEEREASVWLADQMENLPQRIASDRDLAAMLPTIGERLLGAFWTLVLAAALLVDGPRLAEAAERRVPARWRRQTVRLREVSHHAIGGYLAGAALVALLNGFVVFLIAVAVGIALAPVLALWAFAWNFVPQIGGFMGGLPLMILALAEGPMRAVVAGLVFVIYQFVENHLIQPAVISDAIDVPPWVALLAALAGGAAAGLVGAIALTPLIGVTLVVVREFGKADFPGATV
jgi:predicted PurR-regulated permease PerM